MKAVINLFSTSCLLKRKKNCCKKKSLLGNKTHATKNKNDSNIKTMWSIERKMWAKKLTVSENWKKCVSRNYWIEISQFSINKARSHTCKHTWLFLMPMNKTPFTPANAHHISLILGWWISASEWCKLACVLFHTMFFFFLSVCKNQMSRSNSVYT